MKWPKSHWKAPAVVLILLLMWGLWYARPVDIHGLGMGELEAVSASVIHNKAGQGVDLVWSTGAVPDDSQWQTVLKEVERLRFRRPPGNLVREYLQDGTVKTEPADRTSVLFYFLDQDGRSLTMEIGASRSIYTSLHTSSNLPIFLSGGEEAVQALVERLPLLTEE